MFIDLSKKQVLEAFDQYLGTLNAQQFEKLLLSLVQKSQFYDGFDTTDLKRKVAKLPEGVASGNDDDGDWMQSTKKDS